MARGGYRPGAGRPKGAKAAGKGKRKRGKRKAGIIPAGVAEAAATANMTPLDYMLKVMNDPAEGKELRARMAIAAAPFVHPRKGEAGTGKKDEKADRASKAGAGKFAPSKPPLALVK